MQYIVNPEVSPCHCSLLVQVCRVVQKWVALISRLITIFIFPYWWYNISKLRHLIWTTRHSVFDIKYDTHIIYQAMLHVWPSQKLRQSLTRILPCLAIHPALYFIYNNEVTKASCNATMRCLKWCVEYRLHNLTLFNDNICVRLVVHD